MELKDMIYRRKSVRSYTGEPVKQDLLNKIEEFLKQLKPLYPEIGVFSKVVNRDDVRSMMPWATPKLVAIYSENKSGYLENAGFMFQQLDLFLQSLGLGSCWLGLARMNKKTAGACPDGMEFVILIAFGNPKGEAQRNGSHEFKRKSLSEIADCADERLEPARLAPSSVNSQPWYFTHEGDVIHTYCVSKGLAKMLYMNRIDIGIALGQIYVANPEGFSFFHSENIKEIKGHIYMGSFRLG